MQKNTLLQINNESAKLVEAFRANNEAVLKTIYQENYHKVRTYILQNNGTGQQAKDIYQEAFITLWEKIRHKQITPIDSSSVNGYLYTVAKNKWIDIMRSEKHKTMVSVSKFKDSAFLQAEHETVEERTKKEDKLNRTMMAFNKLGRDCKILLTKVYFEKKSMKEIGMELNLDAASAKNKKYRCMQKLRELALKKQ